MRLALEQGLLILPPDFPSKPARYHPWKENLYAKDWVVHTKKPFAGVQHVVKYLARYSHRVAITNHRIKQIDQQSVQFDYKDYADKGRTKKPGQTTTLQSSNGSVSMLQKRKNDPRLYFYCKQRSAS